MTLTAFTGQTQLSTEPAESTPLYSVALMSFTVCLFGDANLETTTK